MLKEGQCLYANNCNRSQFLGKITRIYLLRNGILNEVTIFSSAHFCDTSGTKFAWLTNFIFFSRHLDI